MMKEYGVEVQRLFLEMMLEDAQSYVRVQNIYNPENFDRTLRDAAEFIQTHTDQYKTMPVREQIAAATGVTLAPLPELNEEHYDWFLKEFESFTRRQELERAILKSADLLEKGNFDPVEKLIKDAVQISLTKDIGLDYFADPRARLMMLKDSNGQNSTGWPDLDRMLYGGFNRGELQIFAGSSGCVVYNTKIEVAHLDANGQPTASVHVPIGSLYGKTASAKYLVSSPDGWVRVVDCVQKIKNELYEFVFASGRVIVASYDHLYQKPDLSWHYAKDLLVNDVLLAENNATDCIVSVREINEPTPVYDLSVEHANHRYYTNGICSHNTGKSLFMQNLAVNWSQAGLNGVYITLELSEALCAMRLDSMMTDTSSKEIFKDIDNVEMKVGMLRRRAGALQIKYMPAQSTVNDMRAYLKELQIKTGKKIDFLCVDYLDLLMPVSAKVNPSDVFTKDKYVSEELRNFAKELNVLFVTAAQLNRSAVEEVEFDHSHISGGISKINTADNVFGIFTSRAMRERGRYQLQLLKTRSSSGVGQKVDLAFDIETLRITGLEEGQSTSTGYVKPSNILDSIKTSSTVQPGVASSSSEPAGKITADVQSNKLKQLLGQIKKS